MLKGFSLFFLFTSLIAFGQKLDMINYTMEDGLASNMVCCLLEDSKGYTWFGTDHGVSRFDGSSFKNYGIPEGLNSNFIVQIFEDYKNRIWFVGAKGELSFYANKKVQPYKYNSDITKKFTSRSSWDIKNGFYVDKDDNIYLSRTSQSLVIDSLGRITTSNNNGSYAYELNAKNPSPNKLERNGVFDGDNETKLKFRFDSGNDSIIDFTKSSLNFSKIMFGLKYESGFIFVSKDHLSIIKEEGLVNKFFLGKDVVWSRYDNENKKLFVGTFDAGIFEFLLVNDRLELISNSLVEYAVLSEMTGRNNDIWYTTYANGVFYVPNKKLKYFKKGNSSEREIVSGIVESDSVLYVSYNNGDLAKIEEGEISKWSNNIGFGYRLLGVEKGFLAFNREQAFCINKSGLQTKLSNEWIWPFRTSVKNNGYYYLIYHEGVNRIPVIQGCNRLKNQFDFKKIDTEHSVWSAVMLDSNVILGGASKLYEWTEDSNEWIKSDKFQLSSKQTISVMNKDDQDIYVGTIYNGLYILNDTSEIILNTASGLSSNNVVCLAFSNDWIFVGTNRGISVINKLSHEIYIMNGKSGLIQKNVSELNCLNEVLTIGTTNGLYQLNVNDLDFSLKSAPIIIDELWVKDELLDERSDYLFSFDENEIEVRFSIMSNFFLAKAPKISYRLNSEMNWIEDNTQKLNFTNLSSGEYHLEIKYENRFGHWSNPTEIVSFVIKKAYWEQVWFIIIISILFFSSLGSVIWYRLNKQRERMREKLTNERVLSKLKEELVSQRQRALTQQMNPHFIFNSLNSIQEFILNNDVLNSNKFLGKFSKLMRQTLYNSEKSMISLKDEVEGLGLYLALEQLRYGDHFSYQIIIDEEIDQMEINIPPMLIQPYVENSIWHGIKHLDGVKGMLEINIGLLSEDFLSIEIKDNGIGIEKSRELNRSRERTYQSMGAKITESRINILEKLYGKKIKVEYIDRQMVEGFSGTIVRMNFPI